MQIPAFQHMHCTTVGPAQGNGNPTFSLAVQQQVQSDWMPLECLQAFNCTTTPTHNHCITLMMPNYPKGHFVSLIFEEQQISVFA